MLYIDSLFELFMADKWIEDNDLGNVDKVVCSSCEKRINVGDNCWQLREGVLGVLNFVPLNKPLYFCCEDCHSSYFNNSGDKPIVAKRIP